jgi:hypothetical protein
MTSRTPAECARDITTAQSCGRQTCKCHKATRDGVGLTHCPGHDDGGPSLNVTVDKEKLLVRDFSGSCSQDRLVDVLRERGWWPGRTTKSSVKAATAQPVASNSPQSNTNQGPGGGLQSGLQSGNPATGGLTLEQLAEAKNLSVELLQSFGCATAKRGGRDAVVIPYRDERGTQVGTRYRDSAEPGQGFTWKKGSRPVLYGLDRLSIIRAGG